LSVAATGAVMLACACSRGAPPGADDKALASAAVVPLPPPSGASRTPAPMHDHEHGHDSELSSLGTRSDLTANANANAEHEVLDATRGSAKTLPNSESESTQTDEKPLASSPALERRARGLWDAIVADDPERAQSFFFPLAAYEQVKAVANPAADWRRRLLAAYARDIHALHTHLRKHAPSARWVRIEVPERRSQWVKPGREMNKLGYHRVYGSKIIYAVADGSEHAIDITSLISWRGEWFVVHLTGFR
jgi:hypothetical protein